MNQELIVKSTDSRYQVIVIDGDKITCYKAKVLIEIDKLHSTYQPVSENLFFTKGKQIGHELTIVAKDLTKGIQQLNSSVNMRVVNHPKDDEDTILTLNKNQTKSSKPSSAPKLTKAQREALILDLIDGMRNKDVMKKYNINASTIHYYKKNQVAKLMKN